MDHKLFASNRLFLFSHFFFCFCFLFAIRMRGSDACWNFKPLILSYHFYQGNSFCPYFVIASFLISSQALDQQEMMPLHLACLHGRTDITALLLFRRDAKIRQPARDEQKNTPLHFACIKGHTEIVKLLFSAGEEKICLPEVSSNDR